MDERFQEVEHTADVALRVWGGDLAELFVNAAHGLASLLTDPSGVALTLEREIELGACDVETLLVSWLEELLYLGERDNCVFVNFSLLKVAPTRLYAVARGGAVTGPVRHIKAVTFSDLEVVCGVDGCEVTIVFDV